MIRVFCRITDYNEELDIASIVHTAQLVLKSDKIVFEAQLQPSIGSNDCVYRVDTEIGDAEKAKGLIMSALRYGYLDLSEYKSTITGAKGGSKVHHFGTIYAHSDCN